MAEIKQTLLLTKEAILLGSGDSLFSTKQYINQKVTSIFPFVESIFDNLLKQLENEAIIVFPAVETKHSFLPGYYDYSFTIKKVNGKELIEWQIIDVTKSYKDMQNQQQISNEKKAFPDQNSSDSSS